MALSWRTLMPHAKAIRQLTRAPRPTLPPASFDRVAAIDWTGLPEAERFTVPGGRLGFRHYAAPTGRRLLVLVHGSACFGDLSHTMALQLARQDAADVYTLDMRGHGLSDGRRGHAVSEPEQMIDDIARFLAHLGAARPGVPITLGGHSAGGGLVLAFARSPAQQLASSYIFLAPYLGLGAALNRPYFGGWVSLRTARLTLLTLANILGIRRFNGASVVDFNVAAAQDPRYVASWSYATLLAFGPGRWLNDVLPLPRRKPILVLAEPADECFAAPLFRQAFDVVAPHAEIELVGKGGHWDLLVDPEASAAVAAWLSRQSETRTRRTAVARRSQRAA